MTSRQTLLLLGSALAVLLLLRARRPDGTVDVSRLLELPILNEKPAPGNASAEPTRPASDVLAVTIKPPEGLNYPKDPSVGGSDLPNYGDPNLYYMASELDMSALGLWAPVDTTIPPGLDFELEPIQ